MGSLEEAPVPQERAHMLQQRYSTAFPPTPKFLAQNSAF